jgi:hypothetical protein
LASYSGGSGKSALAKQVFANVWPHFEGGATAYIDVSHGVLKAQQDLLTALGSEHADTTEETCKAQLAAALAGEAVLLVLDGVEQREHLHKLLPCDLAAGSKVIVTSRTLSSWKKALVFCAPRVNDQAARQLLRREIGDGAAVVEKVRFVFSVARIQKLSMV